jgi:mycofactocin precursor
LSASATDNLRQNDTFGEREWTMENQEKEVGVGSHEEMRNETADIVEEIEVEDLTVDGICGVY